MNRYEQIKDALKDIVIPIILGICSIYVAVTANRIAESANETAQLQALIAKNAEAPTIELTPGSSQSESSIGITILDGKYSNFKSDTVSFLSFTFRGYDENNRWTALNRVDIPISYYLVGLGQHAMYGKIWEWKTTPSSEVEQFCDSCKNYYMEKEGIEAGTFYESQLKISVITCLKCTYLNLLEEEESIYYIIGLPGGLSGFGSQISQESGAAWFQKYEDMQADSFFLYNNQIVENDVKTAFQMIDQIKETEKQYLETDNLGE